MCFRIASLRAGQPFEYSVVISHPSQSDFGWNSSQHHSPVGDRRNTEEYVHKIRGIHCYKPNGTKRTQTYCMKFTVCPYHIMNYCHGNIWWLHWQYLVRHRNTVCNRITSLHDTTTTIVAYTKVCLIFVNTYVYRDGKTIRLFILYVEDRGVLRIIKYVVLTA